MVRWEVAIAAMRKKRAQLNFCHKSRQLIKEPRCKEISSRNWNNKTKKKAENWFLSFLQNWCGRVFSYLETNDTDNFFGNFFWNSCHKIFFFGNFLAILGSNLFHWQQGFHSSGFCYWTEFFVNFQSILKTSRTKKKRKHYYLQFFVKDICHKWEKKKYFYPPLTYDFQLV